LNIIGFIKVWSLVGGRLVLEVLSVITIWHAVDWRPSYMFDKKTALELINYGKHVMVANVFVFFIYVIDVMFPAYSKMQGDKNTLKRACLKTLVYVSIIAIPATFGIAIIAWDFVKVVYGDRWLPAFAALQVLCFYGLNRALLGTTEQLYLAAGKPEVRTKLNLLQLILMSILMYPLTIHYGILGTSIAAALPSALIVFLTFREAGKDHRGKFCVYSQIICSGHNRFSDNGTGNLCMAICFSFFLPGLETGCFYCSGDIGLYSIPLDNEKRTVL
jgi:O-antigen/teichoic acid export membrane protein